jgi:hypothetical protein
MRIGRDTIGAGPCERARHVPGSRDVDDPSLAELVGERSVLSDDFRHFRERLDIEFAAPRVRLVAR